MHENITENITFCLKAALYTDKEIKVESYQLWVC